MAIIIQNNVKKGVDFSKSYFGRVNLYGDFSYCKFSGVTVDDVPESVLLDSSTILDHADFTNIDFAGTSGLKWFWEEPNISCKGTNFTECTFDDHMNTKQKLIEFMGSGNYEDGLAFVSAETIWVDGTSILEP